MSQEELYDRLWPDTFVDKNSVHKVVHQLRDALGDDERAIIRTVSGFGFALAGAAVADEGKAFCQIVIGDAEFDLREGENLVGRGRGAGGRIAAPSISRRHARIVVDGARVIIE